MVSKNVWVDRGGELLLSFSLVIVATIFIGLGVTWLPFIGLVIGAGFLAVAIYPWTRWADRKVDVQVNVKTDADFKAEGVIPVVVLSKSIEKGDDYDFDVRAIDGSSVRFGPNHVKPLDDLSDPAVVARQVRDLDGDGKLEYVFRFPREGSGVDEERAGGCIEGRTVDGERFRGCGGKKAA